MSTHLFKIQAAIILLVLAVLPMVGFPQTKPGDKEIILAAQKVIKRYHSGAAKANDVVKVVYFQGKDRDPLANWNERLDRTLTAVNDFYKEEFNKFGIKTDGVNFEKSGGKYVITVIKGDLDATAYGEDSGPKIQEEIAKKAAGKVDFSKDHVLVLTGLSYHKEDGVIVFHSPYYGTGTSEWGVCYASDSEMLDPKYLTDKTTRMRFSERPSMFKECGVAEFNSWYIGGIAHEMGHMLGLYHDFGNPAEIDAATISLMGEYGSRHFGGYLWGDRTSRLSAAGVLQLLSHPIFTKSRREVNTHTHVSLNEAKFEVSDKQIMLKADIGGSVVPYAVSVLIHPTSLDEYRNESSVYLISSMGQINIPLKKWPSGTYQITLLFLFPNGTIQPYFKRFRVDDKGAELADLPDAQTVDIKAYYSKLSKQPITAALKQKLRILESIINPAPPAAADTYSGDSLYLSDAKWDVAIVGWEKPARNYYTTEQESTFFLENQGTLFEKGIFAHSPSAYTFRLNKKWKRFSAIVGLRDGAHQQGSARFTVFGDGKLLYASPALRVGDRSNVNIDITGVKVLELKSNGTEGHNYNSWATWLNPLLKR